MGELSARGSFRSAPRKVQWALMAADDLHKFRQCLSAQLDLVKIVIQTSILSIVGNLNQPESVHTRPPRGLLETSGPYGSAHRMQPYLTWDSNIVDGNSLFRRVDDLSSLVYERLLTKPNIPSQPLGKAYTLPTDFDASTAPPPLEKISKGKVLQSTAASEVAIVGGSDAITRTAKTEKTEHDTLASEMNEYLRSLDLDVLSAQEEEELDQNENGSQKLLLDPSTRVATTPHIPDHNKSEGHSRLPDSGSNSRPKPRNFFQRQRPQVAMSISNLGLASSILQCVELAASLSLKSSTIFRDSRNAPQELEALSKRLIQYSGLLKTAAEVVRTSMPTGELQEMCGETVKDSLESMEKVEIILSKFQLPARRQFPMMLKLLIQWPIHKTEIDIIMEEMESLKSTLAVMLQLYQIKTFERISMMAERMSIAPQRVVSEQKLINTSREVVGDVVSGSAFKCSTSSNPVPGPLVISLIEEIQRARWWINNVVSDTVCPWCYVGKKRLEKGIELYRAAHPESNDTFSISWSPFYLHPNAPNPGIDKQEYYNQRFGPERARMMHARAAQAGLAEGIRFKFGGRTGNTRDSHRLIQLGKTKGEATQTRVVEELFASYFENEGDITSHHALTQAGVKAGLDEAEVKAWLESDQGGAEVDSEVRSAQRSFISGVPNFTIQGKYQLGGAENAEAFVDIFEAVKKAEGP
ncbi:conserved hypothetical protein [Uncinocarpus reesii 1704]|uniref:DSBA-like thioredoxin domain-containing protein n=1 Tax=Uncinocarpus reesii (strain UAMH 1704) TaxID=336963 RepID=C4JWE7_UNCRE|nr:uncharacterized protein UREG_06889 [Uncinocarpus reesii 1704]EEP82024.1 conserved hypothetical protein [Uncinocarpus reesii 1704]